MWDWTRVGWLRRGRLTLVLRIGWWLLRHGHRANFRLQASAGPVSSLSPGSERRVRIGRRAAMKARSTYNVRAGRWIYGWEESGGSQQKPNGPGWELAGSSRAADGGETSDGKVVHVLTPENGTTSSEPDATGSSLR